MVTNSRAKAATKPRSKAKTKAVAKKKTTAKSTGGKSAIRGSAAGKSLVIVESPITAPCSSPRWEHAKLSQRAEEQGAVIGEYPLGVKPHPRSFPRRNRLISGMSLGTLVIEAPETSGAVWTVQHALEQNREVFCVPGSIFSPNSRFTNRMIKEGAKLVSSYTDVLEELNLNVVARQSEMPLDFAPEDEGETDLLRHLHEEPVHIDDIRRSASLPITAVSSMLSILEIKGKVKQVGCMHYVRMQEPTATYGN